MLTDEDERDIGKKIHLMPLNHLFSCPAKIFLPIYLESLFNILLFVSP